MAGEQQVINLYASTFRGIDLKTGSVTKDFNAATICNNLIKNQHGQLETRPGITPVFSPIATSHPIQGIYPFTYNTTDIDNNKSVQELLLLVYPMTVLYAAGTVALYRVVESTLTITYSGATAGSITINPDPGNDTHWLVKAVAEGSSVLNDTGNYAYVNGYTSLDTLRTAINALTDFSCTSLDSLGTASSMDVVAIQASNLSFTNGSTQDLTYYTIELVGSITAPELVFTDANFKHPSGLNFSNNFYFAYGKELYKYDGHRAYRAGMPVATINAIADSASGSTFTTGETRIYKLVYSRVDNKGNIIDGEDSDDTLAVATHTMSATKDVDLTINNVTLSTFTNSDVHGAIVNGGQTGVNQITVDSGHTIIVDDKVYFYDGVDSDYTVRNVTAKDSTSITVDGDAVNVADNAVISNNVRIQIWRTKADDVDFYLIDEIPNDCLNATQTYTDSTADTSVGEPFVDQVRKHSLPPDCSYITTHQGLMMVAGDPANPNRTSWNLPLDIEAFPLESNSTETRIGTGPVTGFGSLNNNAFVIFKKDAYEIKRGAFDDLLIETENKDSLGIGCTSFRTLDYIGDEQNLIGLSQQGPFIFKDETPSLVIGDNIRPLFTNFNYEQTNNVEIDGGSATLFTLQRAIGFHDSLNKLYHLFVPAEYGTPGSFKKLETYKSKWFVLDYDADVPYWTEYTSLDRYGGGISYINPYTGFARYKDIIWFGGIASFVANSIRAYLYKFRSNENGTDDTDDYMDSTAQINVNLHYLPIVREQGSATSFFKPLYITVYRFFNHLFSDSFALPYWKPFSLVIKTINNFKRYTSTAHTTKASRTFLNTDADGNDRYQISTQVKCVDDKSTGVQVVISNDNAGALEIDDPYIKGEKVVFDNVEFIYTTPWDRKNKEPKTLDG